MGGFVDIWGRVAGGLAAYDELAIPFGLDQKKRASSAREAVAALSGAVRRRWLGVMLGSYLRYFADADGNATDPDDGLGALPANVLMEMAVRGREDALACSSTCRLLTAAVKPRLRRLTRWLHRHAGGR